MEQSQTRQKVFAIEQDTNGQEDLSLAPVTESAADLPALVKEPQMHNASEVRQTNA